MNVADTEIKTTSKCTIYKGPTNALVFIKTLIQMSHTKTFKITPTCFDHQMIIIRELSDPG
jgi:predicted O-linked N-acetylglucosamine transferase (SPINDLY family)